MKNSSGYIYVFGNHSAPILKPGWTTTSTVEERFQAFQSDYPPNMMEIIAVVFVRGDVERLYTQVKAVMDMYDEQACKAFKQQQLEALIAQAEQALRAHE